MEDSAVTEIRTTNSSGKIAITARIRKIRLNRMLVIGLIRLYLSRPLCKTASSFNFPPLPDFEALNHGTVFIDFSYDRIRRKNGQTPDSGLNECGGGSHAGRSRLHHGIYIDINGIRYIE